MRAYFFKQDINEQVSKKSDNLSYLFISRRLKQKGEAEKNIITVLKEEYAICRKS